VDGVLFVCVENAGRSLMAEAFMKKYAPNVRVASAGTRPAAHPNGTVVQAMREVGIEVDKTPTLLDSGMLDGARVVNMGCMDRSECPALFVDGVDDWEMPDPKGRAIEDVRRIRDMIEARVREMVGRPV
jgi:protein-tyrosine-phosphatase